MPRADRLMRLTPEARRPTSRREFLAALGSSAVGVSLAAIGTGCGSGPAAPPPVAGTGIVRGTVVTTDGAPEPTGRIYLLERTGLNTGRYVDVDASAAFAFTHLVPGDYQVRYWAGARFYVPEPNPNPVRVTVTNDAPVAVRFIVAPGAERTNVREIYAGDNFFQEQPFGEPNARVVVPRGTVVCWYNVGEHTHTVTGGPWGDSGALARAEEFMWTANEPGAFGYRCRFHDPEMQAILEVVA